jgi:uncharacterized protein (TIGR02186 family)
MRAAAVIAAVLLSALFAATSVVARAGAEPSLSVSPETVKVGLDFGGAEVSIYGSAPGGAEIVVVVDGPPDSVKMNKKGKVMGVVWMTVDQAKVENVPTFHVIQSSKPVDVILGREEQVRLGVDPAASLIMNEAQAVDAAQGSPLAEEKATEFVSALRDMYIRDGRYTPWVCYHEAEAAECDATPSGGIIRLDDGGDWETFMSLPSDAPLGDYSVQAYYVRDGEVVGSDATTFNVEKVGVVDSLGTMSKDNAPLYGAMSLAIAVAMGLTIGFVFPRRGGH